MTSPFSVRAIPQFDRLLRRLDRQHPELTGVYAEALTILRTDPYNQSRQHDILKLKGLSPREGGQCRLCLGRFRYRHDIERREVILYYCGLRREDTYRENLVILSFHRAAVHGRVLCSTVASP
jgi:hypothetical protein